MLFPSVAPNWYVETEQWIHKLFWVKQTKAERFQFGCYYRKLKVSFQLIEKCACCGGEMLHASSSGPHAIYQYAFKDPFCSVSWMFTSCIADRIYWKGSNSFHGGSFSLKVADWSDTWFHCLEYGTGCKLSSVQSSSLRMSNSGNDLLWKDQLLKLSLIQIFYMPWELRCFYVRCLISLYRE